jgi:hypothetical protein
MGVERQAEVECDQQGLAARLDTRNAGTRQFVLEPAQPWQAEAHLGEPFPIDSGGDTVRGAADLRAFRHKIAARLAKGIAARSAVQRRLDHMG